MKTLTCIVCPNGCELSIEGERVSGNLCKRGEEFALEELTHPRRSVTSTVKTVFEDCPVLSCRTEGTVPKESVADVMKEIRHALVKERCPAGTAVIENVAGTGVNVITTKDL